MAERLKILIVRNDKLGDFILTYPSFALLKASLPNAVVHALVRDYTRPMAEIYPWIDAVIIDPESGRGISGWYSLVHRLRQERYDVVITLFSTTRIATALLAAGIPYRLAPATKVAQIFYNHRLEQRRSRSEKPEYAYNLDLICQMLADHEAIPAPMQTHEVEGDWLVPTISRPLLAFSDDQAQLKREFCATMNLKISDRLVFIHPGSGGSATNLRADQYSRLANLLGEDQELAFVISAGPGELPVAKQVAAGINAPAVIYESEGGLVEFARILQLADLFVSGSTGPLHIAGALDRPTAAFYPGHRSATPLRWQTLNSPSRRLAFTPPPGDAEREVANIDIEAAAHVILEHFFPPAH